MYAIIEAGSKQYRVQRGDLIDVEMQPAEGRKVRHVTFDRVLMVVGEGGTKVGTPVRSISALASKRPSPQGRLPIRASRHWSWVSMRRLLSQRAQGAGRSTGTSPTRRMPRPKRLLVRWSSIWRMTPPC